jgi:hypothetical protein
MKKGWCGLVMCVGAAAWLPSRWEEVHKAKTRVLLGGLL